MEQANVVPRINPVILSPERRYLDFTASPGNTESVKQSFTTPVLPQWWPQFSVCRTVPDSVAFGPLELPVQKLDSVWSSFYEPSEKSTEVWGMQSFPNIDICEVHLFKLHYYILSGRESHSQWSDVKLCVLQTLVDQVMQKIWNIISCKFYLR